MKEVIKRALAEHLEIARERLGKRLVERDVPDLRRFLQIPNILALLGVRRCGKSTLALMVARGSRFVYINFDDETLFGLRPEQLRVVDEAVHELVGKPELYILDEIHNVERWELFVQRLRERGERVIVTGSNSRMLAGELASALTGRHVKYVLTPFSFREYLKFRGQLPGAEELYTTRGVAALKRELSTYLKVGGFPEALIIGREVAAGIYADILFKDVVARRRIRDVEGFRDFARSVVSYYAGQFSVRRIAKSAGVDYKTAVAWIQAMTDAYLIYLVPRYGERPREIFTYIKKLYVVDPSIISVAALKKEDMGRLMENVVAMHLLRKTQGEGLYYVRGEDYEVDFYVEDEKWLIQVTHQLEHPRELRALEKASARLRPRRMTVVTWDEEEQLGKIEVVPLYKFLLTY